MQKNLPAFPFVAMWALFALVGIIGITTAGCEAPAYSTNDSDRPWNETRGFQYQGGSRLDR